MSTTLRLDFPEEIGIRRERIFEQMRALLAMQTWESLQQAISLQRTWLEEYPNDYYMLDVGEALAMSEDAFLATRNAEEKQDAILIK